MRQRGVYTKNRITSGAEEYAWQQAAASNAAREIPAAIIEPPKGYLKPVTGDVPVAAEEAAGTLPEIGNHHNVGLVVSRAGFYPCLPFTHVVGGAQVCVPVTPPNLQPTELVHQEEVDHAGDRVRAINRCGAIFEDVDVINHHEGNEVNVDTGVGPGTAQRTKGDTFSV